jgi:hypothetical protein
MIPRSDMNINLRIFTVGVGMDATNITKVHPKFSWR